MQKTNPQKLTNLQKRKKALRLRIKGNTYQQIAETLGYYSASTAYTAIKTELDRIQKVTTDRAERLTTLEALRLDELQAKAWNKIDNEITTTNNANHILRIMERRAKLLGLDHDADTIKMTSQQEAKTQKILIEALKKIGLTPQQWDIIPGILIDLFESEENNNENPEKNSEETE